jgi:alkylated DNA repair dioxygenase AlkB
VRVTMPDGGSWMDYYQLDKKTADRMYEELSQDRHYDPQRGPAMFGNRVPRDQSFYFRGKEGTNKYKFGTGPAHVGKTDIPPLVEAFWRKMAGSYHDFHFAVLNRYVNSKDSIPAHSDSEAEVVRGSAIVSLSLGATRTLVVRPKVNLKLQSLRLPNHVNRLNIALRHGDILVMGGNFQDVYTHEVPKGGPDEARVNLTLRQWVGQ